MRHLSEFSIPTTAVNNEHYKSEWIDTQIFSITLDTNYNTNASEITPVRWKQTLQIKSDRKLRFLYVLFAEKYSLQSKSLQEKRRERFKKKKKILTGNFRLGIKVDILAVWVFVNLNLSPF